MWVVASASLVAYKSFIFFSSISNILAATCGMNHPKRVSEREEQKKKKMNENVWEKAEAPG